MQQLLANQQAQVEHIAILTTIFLWQAIWLGEGGMQLIVCVYIPNGNDSEQITCQRKMAVKIVMCSISACWFASNYCICHSRYANLTGNGLLQDVL